MNQPCLTSTVEDNVILAEKRIWINMVKNRASQGEYLVGLGNDPYKNLDGLTDDQISELVIYGYRRGDIDYTEGYTTSFCEVSKCLGIEKWFIYKPDDKYMAGVINVTQEPFNPHWLPADGE